MAEVEHECFKLGIPAKTRHNEVAPGQFEIDARGNRDSASGRILDSKVLGGRASGEVAYAWRDQQPWVVGVDLTNVNLAPLVPDWPAVVSGRLDSEGTVDICEGTH